MKATYQVTNTISMTKEQLQNIAIRAATFGFDAAESGMSKKNIINQIENLLSTVEFKKNEN